MLQVLKMINTPSKANLNLIRPLTLFSHKIPDQMPAPDSNQAETYTKLGFNTDSLSYQLGLLRKLREECPHLPGSKACCTAVATQRFMWSVKRNPRDRVTRVTALVHRLDVSFAARSRVLRRLGCAAVELDKFITKGFAAGQRQHVVTDAMLAVVRDGHRTPITAAKECTRENGDCAELAAQ